nr:PREDICTED: protein sel-1 homolog 2 isoform X3 [Lepisosteus oculatus]
MSKLKALFLLLLLLCFLVRTDQGFKMSENTQSDKKDVRGENLYPNVSQIILLGKGLRKMFKSKQTFGYKDGKRLPGFEHKALEKAAEEQQLKEHMKIADDLYSKAVKVLSNSRSKKKRQDACRHLVQAADMGSDKAVVRIAYAFLFGDCFPQNLEFAKELFLSLMEEGAPCAQTGFGFMYGAGIGFNQSQARAILYYTSAGLGGDLVAKMILGYRYWKGILMPQNCEAALSQYRSIAKEVSKHLSSIHHCSVELIRIMDMPENQSLKDRIIDLDVYHYYAFIAERGDVQTQVSLGTLHLSGDRGFERDSHKAFYYLHKALKAGSSEAAALLGKMYLEGTEPTPQDNDSAFRCFKWAADRGNPVGLTGLGVMYLFGKGVPVNHTKAFELIKKAAEQKWTDGVFHLGLMYLYGYGVQIDLKAAFQYFTFASKKGHHLARNYLAQMYAKGIGVHRSCSTAVQLFMDVCLQGSWSEMFLQAYAAFRNGDIDSALAQYLFLAEMGYEVAQSNAAYLLELNVSRIFKDAEVYQLAFVQWQRAASHGYAPARVKIGDYHYYGYGMDVDHEAAAVHYHLAAVEGSAQALFNLGYMYEQGIGHKKDIYMALKMYNMAIIASPDAYLPVFLAICKLSITQLFLDYYTSMISEVLEVVEPQWDLYLIVMLTVLLVQLIANRIR